jgi:hypothetical protein
MPQRPFVAAAFACALLIPAVLRAQAWNHPAFQLPTVTTREFNAGVASGDAAGTSILFQWREGVSRRSQLSLDVGLADPEPRDADTRFLLGGQYAHQFHRATADTPLDLLGTAGLFAALGDGANLLRLPVGLVVGHAFALDDGLTLTPYAHPRLSLDLCSDCGPGGDNDSNLGVDADLGVAFGFGRNLSLRAGVVLGGSKFVAKRNAFGVSLAWLVPPLG